MKKSLTNIQNPVHKKKTSRIAPTLFPFSPFRQHRMWFDLNRAALWLVTVIAGNDERSYYGDERSYYGDERHLNSRDGESDLFSLL